MPASRSLMKLLLLLLLASVLGGCSLVNLDPWANSAAELTEDSAGQILGSLENALSNYLRLVEEHDAGASEALIEMLRADPLVAHVGVLADGTIWARYSCGIEVEVLTNPVPDDLDVSGASVLDQSRPSEAPLRLTTSKTTERSQSRAARTALFLLPFYANEDEGEEEARALLELIGFTIHGPFIGDAVTVDLMRTMSAHQVVYMTTHGSPNSLFTGQKVLSRSGLAHMWNRDKTRIGIGFISDSLQPYYTIKAPFIESLSYPDSVIFANACSTLKESDSVLANAFLDSGASVYFGWTDVAYVVEWCTGQATRGVFRGLVSEGNTVDDAYTTPCVVPVAVHTQQQFSIDALFPVTLYKNSDGDEERRICYDDLGSLNPCVGDTSDIEIDYKLGFEYRGKSQFVLNREHEAEATFTIQGRVLLEGTNDHRGIEIEAHGNGQSGNVLGATTTGPDGTYVLTDIPSIPDGEYRDIGVMAQKEGFAIDFHVIRPPQGTPGSRLELGDMVLHSQKYVVFDWVFQPDGTRSFVGPLAGGSTTLWSSISGEIWGEWGDNFCGFIFSTEEITYPVADIYFLDRRQHPFSFWANNGSGGVRDMGAIPLEDLSEAPPSGYESQGIDVIVGHTYCVLTRDGSKYAKLHVTGRSTEAHAQ